MPDREVKISFRTSADSKGAKQVQKDLAQVRKSKGAVDNALESASGDQFANSIKLGRAEIEKARAQLDKLKAKGVNVKVAASGLDQLERDLDSLDPRFETFDKDLQSISKKLKGLKAGKVDTGELSRAEQDIVDLLGRLRGVQQEAAKGVRIKTGEQDVRRLKTRLAELQRELAQTARGTREFRRLANEVKKADRELAKAEKRKLKIDKDAARASRTIESLETRLRKVNAELDKTEIGSRRFRSLQKESRKLNRELGKIRATSGALQEGLFLLPGRLGSVGSAFLSGGKAAGILSAGVLGVTAAIGALGAGIAGAANTQTLEASFSTLLGGIEEAQSRIAELKEFSATTPFRLPDIAKASKVLETLTKGALSTGEGLEAVGNLAASTGENMAALSVHVGRLYDGLQNGRPVGEALARLQELGIISAGTRSEIELLQKEGKKGEEVWEVAARSFGRFAGEMEKQSKTLAGSFSTLADGVRQSLGSLARPLADGLAVAIQRVNASLGFTRAEANSAGKALYDGLVRPVPAIEDLVAGYGRLSDATEDASEASTRALDRLVSGFDKALDKASELARQQEALAQAELELKLAEIDSSDLTDVEKEKAKVDAVEKARVASHARSQEVIRQQLKETERLREQLASQQEEAKQGLAQIEAGNVQDANISKLGAPLLDLRDRLLRGQRRERALEGEIKALEGTVLGVLKIPQLNADRAASALSNDRLKRGLESLLKEASSAGIRKSDISPEAIEKANTRLNSFTERKSGQEVKLAEITDKLAELDASGSSDRLADALARESKLFEVRSKKTAIEGAVAIRKAQERASKERARDLEKAASELDKARDAAAKEQEQGADKLAKSLEAFKTLAKGDKSKISKKIEELVSSINEGNGDLSGIEEFATRFEGSSNDEASSLSGEVLGQLERIAELKRRVEGLESKAAETRESAPSESLERPLADVAEATREGNRGTDAALAQIHQAQREGLSIARENVAVSENMLAEYQALKEEVRILKSQNKNGR